MDDALRLPTCSIGRAMEILGERWTLLILRECFYGVKRFSVTQRILGIARVVLRHSCGHLADPVLVCAHCRSGLDPHEIRPEPAAVPAPAGR